MSSDEVRRAAEITFDSPGDLMVQIIRQLVSDGATVLGTTLCEVIFSSDRPIEETLMLINERGAKLEMGLILDVPGRIGPKGEIDPPAPLTGEGITNTLEVRPGMLTSMDLEPAIFAARDDSGERH